MYLSNQILKLLNYFKGQQTLGDQSLLLVPATSCGDQSHHVNSILATKSSDRDQNLVPLPGGWGGGG